HADPVDVPRGPLLPFRPPAEFRSGKGPSVSHTNSLALGMSCIGLFFPGALRMRTTTMGSFSNSTNAMARPKLGLPAPWDGAGCAPECCAEPGSEPKARSRQVAESQSFVSACFMARPVARRPSFDVRVD